MRGQKGETGSYISVVPRFCCALARQDQSSVLSLDLGLQTIKRPVTESPLVITIVKPSFLAGKATPTCVNEVLVSPSLSSYSSATNTFIRFEAAMVNLLEKLINPLKPLTPKGRSPRGLESNATICHRSGYAERISDIKPLQDARNYWPMKGKKRGFGKFFQARIMRPLERLLIVRNRATITVNEPAIKGEKVCA